MYKDMCDLVQGYKLFAMYVKIPMVWYITVYSVHPDGWVCTVYSVHLGGWLGRYCVVCSV